MSAVLKLPKFSNFAPSLNVDLRAYSTNQTCSHKQRSQNRREMAKSQLYVSGVLVKNYQWTDSVSNSCDCMPGRRKAVTETDSLRTETLRAGEVPPT